MYKLIKESLNDTKYSMILLNDLINSLIKEFKLSVDMHFDVWIVGYLDVNETELDINHPFQCCHYYGDEKNTNIYDKTSIFKWSNFLVEDYVFIINNEKEVWLHVKLFEINKDFS